MNVIISNIQYLLFNGNKSVLFIIVLLGVVAGWTVM